jgi:hypothetical protein
MTAEGRGRPSCPGAAAAFPNPRGDERNYQNNTVGQTGHKGCRAVLRRFFDLKLRVGLFCDRAGSGLKRMLGLAKEKKPAVGMGTRS